MHSSANYLSFQQICSFIHDACDGGVVLGCDALLAGPIADAFVRVGAPVLQRVAEPS